MTAAISQFVALLFKSADAYSSRGAASECSLGRRPWYPGHENERRRRQILATLSALQPLRSQTTPFHGLRPWLHYAAAPRLNTDAGLPRQSAPRAFHETRNLDSSAPGEGHTR